MKKILQAKVEYNLFPNKGICKIDDNLYSIKNTIQGQTISFQRKRKKKGFIEGKLVEKLEKSPLETIEGCPVNERCGGCIYQKLKYDVECDLKKKTLTELYKDIYDEDITFHPSPILQGYRNKMEYTFGDSVKGGPLVLGLHTKNKFYEITDTVDCNIIDEGFNKIRQAVQEYFRDKNYEFFKKIKHTGLLRHFIIRKSFSDDEYMINLVTTSDEFDVNDFVEFAKQIDNRIVSIYHTINDNISDAVIVDKLELLHGKEYLTEKINGLEFRISPFSFFQPNPAQAEQIYNRALELAGDLSGKNVYDLYCGTGTIAQIFAKKAESVIGVEIVAEAVEKAQENAELNGLTNTEFICDDCLNFMEKVEKKDVVVLDPPRDGIHPKAIDRLIDINPDKFIYISCNPITQRLDLDKFIEKGYKIKSLEFFDQFPRTYHCEAVVLLSRK